VICSNAASMPEVAGDAALFIDPRNSDELAATIETVVQNDNVREDLVRRGFKQAGKFSWQRTAQETMEVFRMVASKR